jgi:hypothetical protein
MKRAIFLLLILAVHATPVRAEDKTETVSPELTKSMGQPSRYEFYLAPMVVYDRENDDDEWGGQLTGGIHRHLKNPNLGLGIAGEGYAGGVADAFESGLRLLGALKLLFLQAGVDYSFRHGETDFILSLAFPPERGGLFGTGGNLRIDWLPGRDNSFNFGFTIPIGDPYQGKTRPKDDRVTLPKAPRRVTANPRTLTTPSIEAALDQIERAATWIKIYTTPFFDHDLSKDQDEIAEFGKKVSVFKERLNSVDEQCPEGHTYYAEVMAYHRTLGEAFALALNNEETESWQSARVTNKAKEILLDDVIIPYNRLLGRNKRYDSLKGYGYEARGQLAAWLYKETSLSEFQQERALFVFTELVKILDEIREGSKKVWGDSKLVWIPMAYGLKPSEHDSQEEMDAIVEKVTQDEFIHGNDVFYVINEQFQPEVARMILEAEDYHVLWIHDYRGFTPAGNPDSIGFAQTLYGYFAALTDRVRAYDDKVKLPVYLIIIDQFYYEENTGRLWLELLEDPLEYDLKLPDGYEEWEEQIRQAQEELRAAVQASERLQEGARLFGKDWLRNKIKVHVNITNRADFSFRSRHLIDYMPVAPDALMRDHRKLSFYDVTELDPGKGEAIYGGMGIGEHYAGRTWEDRSILVTGPAILSLKDAAREVLLQQDFKESEIPEALRALPKPDNYAQMVAALVEKGWDATVMDVHNETGFYPKPINALKATLYSLMPPGSTMIIPDSLWNSPFWGGMLAGAALRGCRVLVIAPALENAPSAGFPQMSRAHELFERLIIMNQLLGDEIAAAGGMLKVGKYTRSSDIGSLESLQEILEGVQKYPFLKEIFPFDQEYYDAVEAFYEEAKAKGYKPTYYTEDIEKRKPKLHLKTNFFASKEMQDLLAWDGWDDVILNYLRYRAAQTGLKDGYVDVKDVPEELNEALHELLASYWDSLTEEEQRRVMYYLSVGSQNQCYRGIIMDGEVAVVVSGYYSLIGLVDMSTIASLTTWVDDVEQLNELLPPESGWRRWLGRYIMKAL